MNRSDIAVRRVGPEASEIFARLNEATFAGLAGRRWSVEDFGDILEDSAAIGLLAEATASGETIGYALITVAADDAELLSIGVTESWRGRGVGRRLVADGARLAEDLGAGKIFLDVAETNSIAIGSYSAWGFAKIGRRPNYYSNGGNAGRIAAILMSISLPFSPYDAELGPKLV